MSELPSVMIVDDLPSNLRLMARMLRDESYRVRPFPNGRLALLSASQDPPDLIVLDINMPDMDGYEVCRKLKATPALADIPVIFLSALDDTHDKVKAFQVGGIDYITKPFQLAEIRARISTHLTRRQLERELLTRNQQLQDSLRRLQELETLRDGLVHMLVHDLRAPLTAIIANSQFLLETQPPGDSDRAAALVDVSHSAQHLSEMIHELLDVNRLESGKLHLSREQCRPAVFIQEGISSLHNPRLKERLELSSQTSRPISCDRRLMRRVVSNLVDNARKFSPPNTPIQIKLSETATMLQVEVTDQGPGVPSEYRERIFEKFARLNGAASRHSFGLGLTFCKLAIEAHGGRISVDSPPEGGSRFTFTLPAEAPARRTPQ